MPQEHQGPNWSEMTAALAQQFRRHAEDMLGTLQFLLGEARNAVRASEAGLLVPTEDANELRFLVSLNSSDEINRVVMQLTTPCDRSIAGYVYSTGQPIAITNPAEQRSDLFNPEIDQKAGLTTRVYLALPVLVEGVPLGVQTFVNRPAGEPDEPFGAPEIEWAQRFAALSAVALRYYQRMALPLDLAVADLARATATGRADLADDLVLGSEQGGHGPEAPLARTLAYLEKLSARDQELCADLVALLTHHLGGRGASELDL